MQELKISEQDLPQAALPAVDVEPVELQPPALMRLRKAVWSDRPMCSLKLEGLKRLIDAYMR